MKKRMIIMLAIIGFVLANIFIFQVVKKIMFEKYLTAKSSVPITVSTINASYQEWPSILKATGSLRAVQGINVTTEINGLITEIHFTPGQEVKANDILVQLNVADEIAQLNSLQALAELANVTYERDKAQYEVQAVSKETVDTDAANLKSQNAQVEQQKAVIAKKTIRAPFDGKLGISQVYLGQYLNPGDPIVNLQALDPIYVDFFIPEQQLRNVAVGQTIHITSDSYPDQTFMGKVSTVNPIVDINTRNIQIEATIPNPKKELLPGMFARVEVTIGEPKRYLTLPQSAISYNPYGSIVYVVQEEKEAAEENPQAKTNSPKFLAIQKFIETGATRGDQVEITKGLKEGEQVVTSGQLKLKNKAAITINNSVVPSNDANPHVVNE